MKRIILVALVSTIVAARADLVMQQKVENPMLNIVLTIKIKGDKIRVDSTSGQMELTSMIKNEKTGDTTVLMHKTKEMLKRKQETANTHVPDIAMPSKPLDMGESEKVGGYDTQIYTWTSSNTFGTITEKLWVAKDFPDYKKIKAELPVLEQVNDFGNTKPEVSKLPGMVVKSIRTAKAPQFEQTTTITLISAKEEHIDGSIFEVPVDYTDWKPQCRQSTRPRLRRQTINA